MSTDLENYTANKLTKDQKRATKPTIAEAIDIFADQSMPPVQERSADELRRAQLNLADIALEQEDPEEWLHDVLDALGLRTEVRAQEKARGEPCWPYAGTKRGYSLHLRTYTNCCEACGIVRHAEQEARRARLGLEEGVIINERS